MPTLTCPKCCQAVTDDALDVGQCPACGFPFDGPVVLAQPGPRSGKRLLIAAGLVVAFVGGGAAGLYFFNQNEIPRPQPEPKFVETAPTIPVIHIAPLPHEAKQATANIIPKLTPKDDKGAVAVDVPKKKDGPRPVGVVMKVDPKIAAVRNFDHPDDTASLPDLNTNDRVVLTGRVRVLRIGSVNGKGTIDASALVAEEVIVTGDLSSEAVVKLNAPNGKVTLGGFVFGASKVTITAPGGEVVFAKSSRASGSTILTITARRLEANGPLSGSAKVHLTLTPGGSIKFALMEESASIAFRKAAPGDSAPGIESGQFRGGAKVFEAK